MKKQEMKWYGTANDTVNFLMREQMKDPVLWKRFVQQFRDQIDGNDRGWRGEYWGKTIRGAILIYKYTADEELYEILTETVRDMLTVAEEDGRVSTFTRDMEFNAWDVWCRKYVLLGMEYYYDICRDEALKAEVLTFMKRAADYVVSHLGRESEGKKPITLCCYSWLGVNASSILEPMAWLYRLTGEKRYLDFATYIIENGGSHMHNIFELAYENKIYPYQYGVEKAYEMISCFEGVLEYYAATGIEKWRIAAENFGRALLESEVSVIGCCGATFEMFDHARARQTASYTLRQENCVSVTWLKFCGRLLKLTGDRTFADAMEQTFYNAFLGALNTHHKVSDELVRDFGVGTPDSQLVYMTLPFDSYSPLTPDKRGKKNSGLRIFKDKTFYSCCASIGGAALGTFLNHAVLADDTGVTVNFYEKGTAALEQNGVSVKLGFDTDYPADGTVRLTVSADAPTEFALRLRLPAWSEHTTVSANRPYTEEDGYAVLRGTWEGETTVTLTFDMRIRETYPITWDTDVLYTATHYNSERPVVVFHKDEDDNYVCLTKGPLVLAIDSRTGKDAHSVFEFCRDEDGTILHTAEGACEFLPGNPCMTRCTFPAPDGTSFVLTDYASAGKDWYTHIAAWLPTK